MLEVLRAARPLFASGVSGTTDKCEWRGITYGNPGRALRNSKSWTCPQNYLSQLYRYHLWTRAPPKTATANGGGDALIAPGPIIQ